MKIELTDEMVRKAHAASPVEYAAEFDENATRKMLLAALSAAEPQPAPSVAVKAAWAVKAAVLRSRGKNNTLYDINQAADYLDDAALSAQAQDVAVTDGWQLVPKEPTQEMCEAAPSLPAIHAIDDLPLKKSGWSMSAIVNRKRYLAMLAAAPAKQEGQHDLGQLEIRLQELIAEKPKWAQLAAIDDHTRMWFVSELISHASGRIPLLEIEGLVSRHLAAVKGGEA